MNDPERVGDEMRCKNCGRRIVEVEISPGRRVWAHVRTALHTEERSLTCPGYVAEPMVGIYDSGATR